MNEATYDRTSLIDSLRCQGCNLIELQPNSKRPKAQWKEYQTKFNESIFPEDANYGVLGGEISNNLIILDLDKKGSDGGHSEIDIVYLDKVIRDVLKKTLVVRTGTGGYHIYLRNDSSNKQPRSNNLDAQDMHIDIQSTGKFVVGPGSIHPNKRPYQVVSATTTIMTINFKYVLEQLEQLGFSGNSPHGKTLGRLEKINFEGEDWDSIERGNIEKGTRNTKMHKLLCRRLCYDKLFDTLDQVEQFADEVNQNMQKQGNGLLAEYELKNTVKSAWDFYQREKEAGNLIEKSEMGERPSAESMGNYLIMNWRFATLRDTTKMYVYDEGVYVSEGDHVMNLIKEECYQHKGAKKSWVDEVITYVQAKTLVSRSIFDNSPYEIVLVNGILNIKTLDLRPHDPDFYSLVKIPLEYNPDARCPKFLKFLTDCFTVEGKFRQKDYFTCLEVFALTLLKHSRLEKAVMFIGAGANGKSTYLDVLQAVIGRRNVSARTMHDLSKEKFAKIDLFNKLANVFSDIQGTELYDTGMLKAMISGDVITAEEKFGRPFHFRPHSKLIFSANRFPPVSDQSPGFFRRFIIVEWERVFDKDKNVHLKYELISDKRELSGIFNLIVRLAKMLDERGHIVHEQDVMTIRQKWNEKSEPINTFLDTETEVVDSENAYIPINMLYSYYVRWCKANNLVAEKARKFNKIVGEANQQVVKKDEGTATRVWANLRLKHPLGGKQTELKPFE